MRIFFVVLSAMVMFTACASRQGPSPTPGNETVAPVKGPPKPWAEMTGEERSSYMSGTVVPTMEPLFQRFDSERYAKFGCRTCHDEDSFHMPATSKYALYPTGTPQQEEMVAKHRPTTVFMFNEVLPTMQTLMGAPDYDEATGSGFSCFSCHPKGDSGEEPAANPAAADPTE